MTMRTVLGSLADGATNGGTLADFPTLTLDQLRAVIAFAAASAEEEDMMRLSAYSFFCRFLLDFPHRAIYFCFQIGK